MQIARSHLPARFDIDAGVGAGADDEHDADHDADGQHYDDPNTVLNCQVARYTPVLSDNNRSLSCTVRQQRGGTVQFSRTFVLRYILAFVQMI